MNIIQTILGDASQSDLVWSLVAVILILILLAINLRRNIFLLRSDISDLKTRRNLLKSAMSRQASTISVQLSFIIKFITDLSDAKDRIPSTTAEGKKLKGQLDNLLDSFKSPQVFTMIIEAVNDSHDGIIDTLRMACPELTEQELMLYALSVEELNQSAIYTLLGIKRSSFFAKRKSLTDTITATTDLSPEHKEMLLKYLTDPTPKPNAD